MNLKKNIVCFVLLSCSLVLKSQVQEKILISTDKTTYHAGEILWLRIDVVDAANNRPLAASKIAYVELLDAKNAIVLQGKVEVEEALAGGSFFVPVSIEPGIYSLRAYTSWMKNFPPEHYGYRQLVLLNAHANFPSHLPELARKKAQTDRTLDIMLSSDKKMYSSRQKIQVQLSANYNSNISLSVYRLDSLQQPGAQDFAENIYREHADLDPILSFAPEIKGHIIMGRVVDARSGKPSAGVTAYLSGPGDIFGTATSDSMGYVRFYVNKFYGDNELVLQTNNITRDSSYSVELVSPFSNAFASQPIAAKDVLTAPPTALLNSSVNAQVQRAFHSSEINNFKEHISDTTRFYGKPNVRYAIDEYVRFSNMEDVLREYVTPVGVKRKNAQPYPFVFDELRRKPFTGDPLLLVNGVPVFNLNYLMEMDPFKLSSISVVSARYFMGTASFDGIIDVVTKSGSIDEATASANASIVSYEGLQKQRLFYSPVYESKEQAASRMPDFRSLLYWAPSIRLGKNTVAPIEFYSSDVKGKFVAVATGITAEGQTGYQVYYFDVQ